MSRRSALASLGAAGLLLLSGCGGAPTSGPAPGADQPTAAEAVYAEVGALTGTARHDRLVELAAQEGNTLSVYTSLNADIADIVVPQFEQATGIDVEVYRADSETVLQRTLQEASAGFAGADVVETNATQMAIIASQGLTGDYEGEQRNKINEQFRYDGWTPTRFNIFAPAWNTNLVRADLVPRRWEDLADPKYDGILSLEVSDYDWYMTLYTHYRQQGMADADIDRFFADMVRGSKVAKGHSGQVELLSAGEFGVVAASYTYLTEKARASGAGGRSAVRRAGRGPRQRRRAAAQQHAPGRSDAVHGLAAEGRPADHPRQRPHPGRDAGRLRPPRRPPGPAGRRAAAHRRGQRLVRPLRRGRPRRRAAAGELK
jgi:iron(III) transport system substrate-binding protein